MSGKFSLLSEVCQVCGNDRWRPLFEVQDNNQGVSGTWHILVCCNCGLGILWPLPSNDEIASYYLNFYTLEGQRFNHFVEKARSLLAGLRGHTLRKLVAPGGKLLDFGAGSGHFGAAMEKNGYEVISIDLGSNKKYETGNPYFSMKGDRPYLHFPDDSFDAVTLWYVIEHMRSPRKVLEEMRRVLRPGGVLLLAQQNFESFQARVFGPRWLLLDPPRHLYQFSPGNLIQMTKQIGFQYITIRHGSLEMGPFTILQSTLNTLLRNENQLFRFFKNQALNYSDTEHGRKRHDWLMIMLSLVLSTVLGPLSLVTYYILLAAASGDVFTLYFRKCCEDELPMDGKNKKIWIVNIAYL